MCCFHLPQSKERIVSLTSVKRMCCFHLPQSKERVVFADLIQKNVLFSFTSVKRTRCFHLSQSEERVSNLSQKNTLFSLTPVKRTCSFHLPESKERVVFTYLSQKNVLFSPIQSKGRVVFTYPGQNNNNNKSVALLTLAERKYSFHIPRSKEHVIFIYLNQHNVWFSLTSFKRTCCFHSPQSHRVSGLWGIDRFLRVSGPCTLHNMATNFCIGTRSSHQTNLYSLGDIHGTEYPCNTCSCADKSLERE